MSFLQRIKKPEYYFRPSSILKKLFSKKTGIIVKKTPWRSKIKVDIEDTIGNAIYKTGIYDLAITEILWRLIEPGDFVLDIGANIGFTTNICSYKTGANGKVWSFEPNPLILQRLSQNIDLNTNKNITLFPIALSDSNAKGFLVFPQSFKNNNGTAFIGSGSDNGVLVDLKKLDDILPKNNAINVMKIDVEGHELAVLIGAENTINQKLIETIVFEDHHKYPSEVASFLLDHGYEIFRIEKGWLNVLLTDPLKLSYVNRWEPSNYLATLNIQLIKKKTKKIFYRSLWV